MNPELVCGELSIGAAWAIGMVCYLFGSLVTVVIMARE